MSELLVVNQERIDTDATILQQPNIPKPLHGLNPRTIKGQGWWDEVRNIAYKSTDYHCLACGIQKYKAKYHQWLEAHEEYEFNYEKGMATIKKIIPLCHSCHNFIHSGRLYMLYTNGDYEHDKAIDILESGFRILKDNNLAVFPNTLMVAEEIGASTYGVVPYALPSCDVPWDRWRLILDGKEYKSKFADQEEWASFHRSL